MVLELDNIEMYFVLFALTYVLRVYVIFLWDLQYYEADHFTLSAKMVVELDMSKPLFVSIYSILYDKQYVFDIAPY